jgi:hypothetical protein
MEDMARPDIIAAKGFGPSLVALPRSARQGIASACYSFFTFVDIPVPGESSAHSVTGTVHTPFETCTVGPYFATLFLHRVPKSCIHHLIPWGLTSTHINMESWIYKCMTKDEYVRCNEQQDFKTSKAKVSDIAEAIHHHGLQASGEGDRLVLRELALELLATCETPTDTVLRLVYQVRKHTYIRARHQKLTWKIATPECDTQNCGRSQHLQVAVITPPKDVGCEGHCRKVQR